MRRLLATRYEVEACADGEAALAAVHRHRPDLVLADVMMPKLDGLGLVRALRADPRTRTLPAILLSARAGEEARIEGYDAGADDYLFKPFSGRELLAHVAARLELGRLQAALQAERTALSDLFAQTPVPTAVLRGQALVFERANPAYLEIVGGRQLVGKPVLEALPELRGQGFDTLLRGVMQSGRAHVGREVRVRLERGGDLRDTFFTFIYAPLRGTGGEFDGVIVICNDVTEQVSARERIRESEARYRRLVQMLPMAVYTCEAPSGVITYYNEHAAQLWGRAPRLGDTDERFCGSFRLWRPDGAALPHAETPMAQALLEGREFRNQEVTIERPDGSRITVLVNIDPLRDAAGRIVGAINAFHDTTALKRAEQALKEADRRKDEFLAMLSHELRNPLAPIRNAVLLLQDATLDPRHRNQACAILERQVDHMIRLVDDLLDIARISRGTMELNRQVLEVAPLVDMAVETSRPLIQAAGHRLEVRLPQEPVCVLADRVRLAQVVANLLNNAAKYTPEGGKITVEVRADSGFATIAVSDDGIGIPAEALPRVFDMFVQLDQGASTGSGLGIGLALAHQVVQLHGGRITAYSAGPGRGSEFVVQLPALASGQALTLALPPRQHAAAAPGRRILLVEDNVDSAQTLALVLERMGHAVQLAFDGRAALEAARRDPPELILADIDLPGFDGFTLARRLREDPRFRHVPMIALTGFGQEADRGQAHRAGFDHHLIKPADIGALQSLLSSLQ